MDCEFSFHLIELFRVTLVRHQDSAFFLAPQCRKRSSGGNVRIAILFAWFCLFVTRQVPAQEAEQGSGQVASGQAVVVTGASSSTDATQASPTESSPRPTPESEIIVEGLASYGHYRLLASGSDCHVFAAGFEYDRHSWGRLLGARFDYTAEILPLILLDSPTAFNIWGDPQSPNRKVVYGVGISPIGLRLMWFDKKAWKPYLIFKGGMLSFTQKELSSKSTYENFTFEPGFGLQVRLNDRVDLRLGLFSDFHFSNGFITPVDPGLDVMDANLGVSFHLRQRSRRSTRRFHPFPG